MFLLTKGKWNSC